MAETFPNLAKDTDLQIQEGERTTRKDKLKEIHTNTHVN